MAVKYAFFIVLNAGDLPTLVSARAPKSSQKEQRQCERRRSYGRSRRKCFRATLATSASVCCSKCKSFETGGRLRNCDGSLASADAPQCLLFAKERVVEIGQRRSCDHLLLASAWQSRVWQKLARTMTWGCYVRMPSGVGCAQRWERAGTPFAGSVIATAASSGQAPGLRLQIRAGFGCRNASEQDIEAVLKPGSAAIFWGWCLKARKKPPLFPTMIGFLSGLLQ